MGERQRCDELKLTRRKESQVFQHFIQNLENFSSELYEEMVAHRRLTQLSRRHRITSGLFRNWPLWGLEQPTLGLSLSLSRLRFSAQMWCHMARLSISVPRSSSLRVWMWSTTRDYAEPVASGPLKIPTQMGQGCPCTGDCLATHAVPEASRAATSPRVNPHSHTVRTISHHRHSVCVCVCMCACPCVCIFVYVCACVCVRVHVVHTYICV